MIIMYPHRIVRADGFQQSCTKGLIDPSILRPVLLVVFGIRGKVVEKRPDSLVAEALIKIFKILPGKKNRIAAKFSEGSRFNLLLRVGANRTAWPTDPKIIGRDTLRIWRRKQSPQAGCNSPRAILEENAFVGFHNSERQAIGNHDDSAGLSGGSVHAIQGNTKNLFSYFHVVRPLTNRINY